MFVLAGETHTAFVTDNVDCTLLPDCKSQALVLSGDHPIPYPGHSKCCIHTKKCIQFLWTVCTPCHDVCRCFQAFT